MPVAAQVQTAMPGSTVAMGKPLDAHGARPVEAAMATMVATDCRAHLAPMFACACRQALLAMPSRFAPTVDRAVQRVSRGAPGLAANPRAAWCTAPKGGSRGVKAYRGAPVKPAQQVPSACNASSGSL